METTPEQIKEASGFLRGSILDELAGDDPKFSHESEILLKFHGVYQQDNRDVRRERTQAKLPLDYICMVRASIPGGVLTSAQYLAMDRLADEVADGSLRITTRQGVQYHFTRKGSLQQLIGTLNRHLVTTLAACGDVVRNTMCCPAPIDSAERRHLHDLTASVARRFRPKTDAYYELWVNGERAVSVVSAQEGPASGDSGDVEPIYGRTYLPRKFKIGVAVPGDNCIDAYTQDVAAVAHSDGESVTAFTVLVGGGFGVSHADETTYPRLGTPLTTISPSEVEDVIEAIVVVQRDHGERGDRKHARLKYLVDKWGIEQFKSAVETRLGRALPEPLPIEWRSADDHLGWCEQGGGKWFLGVRVESGRIVDRDDVNVRSAFREIVERFGTGVRFTPNQDVLFTDINSSDRVHVEAILRKAHVPLADELVPLVRSAMACPALPTCGLALTEAERVLPEMLQGLHMALEEIGLGDEPVSFRMTGCPNGCARPYSAEIGLVGRGKTSYDIMLGGSRLGTRLAQTLALNVKRGDVVDTLKPILTRFRDERIGEESFGDWCTRAEVGSSNAV